jgi:hypothetical protein
VTFSIQLSLGIKVEQGVGMPSKSIHPEAAENRPGLAQSAWRVPAEAEEVGTI